jgi:hypothetical protein
MALMRGVGSKHPCPVCVVDNKSLSNLMRLSEPRTRNQTMHLIAQARLSNTAERKKLLTDHGLHNVDVSYAFVSVYTRAHFIGRMHSGTLRMSIRIARSLLIGCTPTTVASAGIIFGKNSKSASRLMDEKPKRRSI